MAAATCGSCRFFSGPLTEPTDCRKNPPTLVTVPTVKGLQTFGTFPPTKKENWCGAFERHPDDANDSSERIEQ